MERDFGESKTPTRRDCLTYGGAVVGGALLAGCTGNANEGSDPTETATETSTRDDDGSYTVTMAPMGEVTFESVPQSVYTVCPWHADLAFALGHGDSINSLWYAKGFDQIMNYYLSALDGVPQVEWAELPGSYNPKKEQLLALDSDVHLVDPAFMSTKKNWDESDIETIRETVGPWFGNYYSNLHATPPDGWADRYRYYTLWELSRKIAQVFREEARYEALASVHTDLLATIDENLPPADDRPTAAYLSISTDLEAIYILKLNSPGYYNAHTRPLGATDVFADADIGGEFKKVDFETLLDADPDVILTTTGLTESDNLVKLRENLAEHPVGQELSAVKNDRVHVQGTRFQGPIMNLFQLEMTAKQLYPEQFGEWPTYVDGEPYPDFPDEEHLFDHQRVADVINGNIS